MPVSHTRHPLSVLIVEDDASSREVFGAFVKLAGHNLIAAVPLAEEALDIVQQVQVDIVVMDIVLVGGMDGIEAGDRLRREHNVPIIYVSGMSDEDRVTRALATDPGSYLVKPVSQRELAIALELAVNRHRLEQDRIQREVRLRAVLEALPTAVLHYEEGSGIVFANAAAVRLLGEPNEQLVGKEVGPVLELYTLHEHRPVDFFESFKLDRTNPRHYLLQSRQRHRHIVRIHRRSMPYGDHASGEVVLIEDQTTNYQSEQQITLLASAIEHLEEGVLVVRHSVQHEALEVVYTNPASERITRRRRSELLETGLELILDRSRLSDLTRALQRTEEENTGFSRRYTLTRPDGSTYYAELAGSKITTRERLQRYYVLILRDLTYQQLVEDNLQHALRMETVAQLAQGVAHQFNNIIAIISGISQLLKYSNPPESDVAQKADKILETSRRGAAVVSQLMTFSLNDPHHRERLDLATLVREVEPLIRLLLPEQIQLRFSLPTDSLEIEGNASQIEQVLLHLACNARDAIGSSRGRVNFEVQELVVEAEDFRTAILPPPPGRYACLKVDDDGCGIPAEKHQEIFHPFYSGHAREDRMGLGLSTAYTLMQSQGGGIAVDSAPGEGARFVLFFPVTAEAKSEPAKKEERAQTFKVPPVRALPPRDPSRPSHVLMVDDGDLALRAAHTAMLARGAKLSYFTPESDFDKVKEIAAGQDLLLLPYRIFTEISDDVQEALEANDHLQLVVIARRDEMDAAKAHLPKRALLLPRPFPLRQLLEIARLG
ncbi:MAG: response regulator [Verrucomicrobiota bacterium JB022]|nr:response regulator [Verrucomicrobiota bacterium JB022]